MNQMNFQQVLDTRHSVAMALQLAPRQIVVVVVVAVVGHGVVVVGHSGLGPLGAHVAKLRPAH